MENNILSANDKDFNRLWEIMKEISATEKHFNELETKYRILASQWLLASFAGMGFILTAKTELPFNNLWMIIGICLVSALGIFQLWRMDLIVYHQLLHATFSIGVALENHYTFLPKIKNAMLFSQKGTDVTKSIVFYYSLSVSLLLTIATAVFLVIKYHAMSVTQSGLVILLLACLLVILNKYMYSKSVERGHGKVQTSEKLHVSE